LVFSIEQFTSNVNLVPSYISESKAINIINGIVSDDLFSYEELLKCSTQYLITHIMKTLIHVLSQLNKTFNKTFLEVLNFIAFLTFIMLFTDCSKTESKMEYSIEMDKPSSHVFQINFHYTGNNSGTIDCKLPVWTPGYYWITNFPKNVFSFSVANEAGKSLNWEKTDKNTWRIKTENARTITVKYCVYAFTQSVADPFLDAGRAYIPPAGLFMYVDGKINHPVSIEVKPYKEWQRISTGLDKVQNKLTTFYAQNFDILYDSPILVGNQGITTFKVNGKQHYVAMEFPKDFDTSKLTLDFKRIVETSASIMGDIPYKHYTFIIMGEGRGGLEHSNSMAVFSNGKAYNPNDVKGYKRWLSFIAHEYFHLYNIKSIRPINLGPFDYNKENNTKMLWFSEGGTVYYEYLIGNRAGFLNQNEFLEEIESIIRNYEDVPGHLFQSATESSFDTWINFFNRSENAQNTTISYYDKGFALCLLLDLKIRYETDGRKSLDDLMRTLYNKYHIKMGRGFKDEEFRDECAKICGCSLNDIFTYASTVNKIDYQKYLEPFGLSIDTTPKVMPDCWFGATYRDLDKKIVVSSVEWNSPSYNADLSAQDTIISVNGKKVDRNGLKEIIKKSKEGDKLLLLISNRTQKKEISITLQAKRERSFKINQKEKLSLQQKKLLEGWLKQ